MMNSKVQERQRAGPGAAAGARLVLPTVAAPTAGGGAADRHRLSMVLQPVLDTGLVVGAWVFACAGAVPLRGGTVTSPLLLVLLTVASAAVTGALPARSPIGMLRTVETGRLIRTVALGGVGVAVLDVFLRLGVGPVRLLFGVVGSLTLLVIEREIRRLTWGWLRSRGRLRYPVVLVGSNEDAVGLARLVREHHGLGVDLIGRVAGDVEAGAELAEIPWLGPLADMPLLIREHGVRAVLIAASALHNAELNELVRELAWTGVDVHVSSGLQGLGAQRVVLSPVALEPLLFLSHPQRQPWQRVVTRVVDLVGALVVLLVTWPVLVAAAVLIRAEDGGSVLFRQQRVGRDGVPFTLYKLRTMVEDAEDRLVDLRDANQRAGGPLFKMDDDPRVTRMGRFLRASSIDELPQLFNIIRGDMRLVGPRPALEEEVAEFSPRLQRRCVVKPGITGLWQVEARDDPSFWSYLRLDLYYVENWTLSLDIAILLATVPVVLMRGVAAALRALGVHQGDQAEGHVKPAVG